MAVNGPRTKVLLLAAFFPPAGGVGTFRASKFVKYLPRFGVDVDVVALKEAVYLRRNWPMDLGMLEQVRPEVRVFRTEISRFPWVRDIGILWTFRLPFEVPRIMNAVKPDVVMFTGDPFFPMVLGPVLRLCYGCKYILDFRDPWSLAERNAGHRSLKLRVVDLISRCAEWFSLRWCEQAVVVSEPMRTSLEERYPSMREKFLTISNGYDPEDYETPAVDTRASGALLYTGKFRTGERYRDPKALFRALKQLASEGLRLPFVHIGAIEKDVVEAAVAAGLDLNGAKWEGFLPLHSTIACIKGARVGVIIGGGQRSEQTTKVFDYMACRIPILAIVNRESNVAAVLAAYPLAVIVENEERSIAEAIRSLLTRSGTAIAGDMTEYSRITLAEKLSRVVKRSCILRDRSV